MATEEARLKSIHTGDDGLRGCDQELRLSCIRECRLKIAVRIEFRVLGHEIRKTERLLISSDVCYQLLPGSFEIRQLLPKLGCAQIGASEEIRRIN